MKTPMEDEEHNRITKKKKKDKMKKNMDFGESRNVSPRLGMDKTLNKMDEMSFKIETVCENPDKISPFVGYFPSGFNAYVDGLTRNQSQQPRVGIFRDSTLNKRLQLVVSSNSSHLDFVGTNYLGEATAPTVCNYALGILDKATNTLKLVPIAANKIFRLEPKLAHAELTDNETSQLVKGELTQQEKADKTVELFSTKKNIRQVQNKESFRPKLDPKSQEYLDYKLEKEPANKAALEVSATTGSEVEGRNIPPYDLSATTPQKAYLLDKIILKGEWDYLLDIFELSRGESELKPEFYPSFVRNRVYKLDHIKDEEIKKRLACIFSYITHLVKFKNKHSMDDFSSAKNHKFPSILFMKFSDMFADSNSKRLSDTKMDLLISYILVLTLFVDDFHTDPSDIAKDLRLSAVTLRDHYKNLGCKLVQEGKVSMVKLSVPLKLPTLRRKRRRGQ